MALSKTSLAALEAEVRTVADVEAFGIVLPSGDADVCLFTRHRSGTTSHLLPRLLVPPLLRPEEQKTPIVLPVSSLDPQHLFTERIQQYSVATVISVPLRSRPGIFWAGVAHATTFDAAEVAAFAELAEHVAAAHTADESLDT